MRIRKPIQLIPLYSPRSSYKRIKEYDDKMIADMTLNFDRMTINLLKKEFELKSNQLRLQDFIVIAKKHLKFWQLGIPNRDIALIRYLTYLFIEIDINGNGDMEWDQFTNYIIEKATVLKNLKSKVDEVKQYVRSQIIPKIKIDGTIQKLEYLSGLDKVAFFQQGSNTINFMKIDTGQIYCKPLVINPKKLIINLSSVKKQRNGKVSIRKKDLILPTQVRVLDMLYLEQEKYKILLVASSDGFVRGWQHTQNGFIVANQPDNQEEYFQHYFIQEVYCLSWDHINEILYCGQKSGIICMWNLKTDLEKMMGDSNIKLQKTEEEQANMMVTCMITMPKLQFMASGRMDGKLILWDTINNHRKWIYKEHSKGILTLAFNQSMILLFSAGFDHKICIWNPYISTIIHKIEGHLAPIISLKIIEGTHQLISLDSQGIVKITDSRRFNIISSFSAEVSETSLNNQNLRMNSEKNASNPNSQVNNANLSCLIAINKPLKLIMAGRTISIYQYDKNYKPHMVDENVAICCHYVKQTLSFFTPVGNKIKVWSALNGDIQKIYMDVTSHEISTFTFDFLKKRMLIGDTKGNITLHNTANGAKMKHLATHLGQITFIITTQNDSNIDIFISCAADNEIKICKQTEESYQILRTIYLRKDIQVTCMQYCSKAKLIIVGSNVGNLTFYELQTGKAVGTSLNLSHEQFTSLCVTDKPIVISTTCTGKISFIAIPPFPNRFEKLLTFHHQDCEKNNSSLGVHFAVFSKVNSFLYLIDDKMYLTCYNLKSITTQLQKQSLFQEKLQSDRRKSLDKLFHNAKIMKQWQIKCHNQVIKNLQYIEEENILITTSFDKRVKIWNALSGKQIDSLQQNYNKIIPVPVGYYDPHTKIIYSADKRKTIEDIEIDSVKLMYDPFAFEKIYSQYTDIFTKKYSNKDWKLNINFKQISAKQIQNFQNLKMRIIEQEKNPNNNLEHQKQTITEIREKLQRHKKVLKEINYENNMKQRSNFLQKEEEEKKNESKSNIHQDLNIQKQKKCIVQYKEKTKQVKSKNKYPFVHKDYISIVKLLKGSKKTQNSQNENKKIFQKLFQRQTKNIQNSRLKNHKIQLSSPQFEAARKLGRLISTTETQDRRSDTFFSTLEVRKNEQKSLNSKKLPLI